MIATLSLLIKSVGNALSWFGSLVLSITSNIFYALFYVLTLPFTIAFHIVYYHPFLVLLMFISMLLIVAILIVCYRRRNSLPNFGRSLFDRFLSHFVTFTFILLLSIIPLVSPQLNAFIHIVQLILTPFIAFYKYVSSLPLLNHHQPSSSSSSSSLINEITIREEEQPNGSLSLSSSSSQSQSQSERLVCCMCMIREKSVLLRPCNHLCLCSICFKQLSNDNDNDNNASSLQCPLCRTNIHSSIQVYI